MHERSAETVTSRTTDRNRSKNGRHDALTALHATAGNAAVVRLLSVQRSPIRLGSRVLPFTAAEDGPMFRLYVAQAPEAELLAVRAHVAREGASPWDVEVAGPAVERELRARGIGTPAAASSSSAAAPRGVKRDARGAPREATPVAASGQASVSLPDRPPNEIAAILRVLPYSALAGLMSANRTLFLGGEDHIRRQIGGPRAEGAGITPLYGGIAHLLGRRAPGGRLNAETGRALPVTSEMAGLVAEIVRAVGWRHFSSRLADSGAERPLTLASFADLVERHVLSTETLRDNPESRVRVRSAYAAIPGNVTALAADLARHWLGLKDAVGAGTRRPADTVALSAINVIGRSDGANVTVTIEQGRRYLYSNIALTAPQRERLSTASSGQRPTLPPLVADPVDRERFGLLEGRGRVTERWQDLPFHSEMQRRALWQPWLLTYAGNIYRACVQCLAAYYALGVPPGPAGGFSGTHGAKAPSVIPPAVRLTSVYLEGYVGPRVWGVVGRVLATYADVARQVARLEATGATEEEYLAVYDRLAELPVGLDAVFDLLDAAERANKGMYAKLGIASAPTRTF